MASLIGANDESSKVPISVTSYDTEDASIKGTSFLFLLLKIPNESSFGSYLKKNWSQIHSSWWFQPI